MRTRIAANNPLLLTLHYGFVRLKPSQLLHFLAICSNRANQLSTIFSDTPYTPSSRTAFENLVTIPGYYQFADLWKTYTLEIFLQRP